MARHGVDFEMVKQAALENERALQEESEIRWIQIIDQSRSENKNLQKKYDEMTRKQNDKIEELRNNLIKLQDTLAITQATLNHKNELIDSQEKKLEKMQSNYTSVISELAVLKSKSVTNTVRKTNKKLLEAV